MTIERLKEAVRTDDVAGVKAALPGVELKDIAAQLILAARRGKAEIVTICLQQGLEPEQLNDVDESGMTALIHAAENGHVEVVKVLVSALTPEQIGGLIHNRTPLICAVLGGHQDVVQELVRHLTPEQICAVNMFNVSALRMAVMLGCSAVVQALLAKNLSPDQINALDPKDGTHLMRAAAGGKLGVVQAFLAVLSPEQVNVANRDGKTALELAIAAKHIKVAMLILSKVGQQPKSVGRAARQIHSCDMSKFSGNIIDLDLGLFTLDQVRDLKERVLTGGCTMMLNYLPGQTPDLDLGHQQFLDVCQSMQVFAPFFKKYKKHTTEGGGAAAETKETEVAMPSAAATLFELSCWAQREARTVALRFGKKSNAYRMWRTLVACHSYTIQTCAGDAVTLLMPRNDFELLQSQDSFTLSGLRQLFAKSPTFKRLGPDVAAAFEKIIKPKKGETSANTVVHMSHTVLCYDARPDQTVGVSADTHNQGGGGAAPSIVNALGGSTDEAEVQATHQGADAGLGADTGDHEHQGSTIGLVNK